MNTSPSRPMSTSAVVSLCFGIVSWVLLPVVAAIVAVVAGHMARGEIRRSAGQIDGEGLALAGLILGYLNLLLSLLTILAVVFGVFAFAGLAWLGGA